MQTNQDRFTAFVREHPGQVLICGTAIGLIAGYIWGNHVIGRKIKTTVAKIVISKIVGRLIQQ